MNRSRKDKILAFWALVFASVMSLCGILGVVSREESEHFLRLASEMLSADVIWQNEAVVLPTVTEVDGGKVPDCDGESCGLGEYADVSSVEAFYNFVNGTCQNTDQKFGAQCWDLVDLAMQNMVGRNASTCGTSAAKDIFACEKNWAGFRKITNFEDLVPGTIASFEGGVYGHVGIVIGYPKNGYVPLLGQNQGGQACEGGGSAANVINMNGEKFIGGLLWEGWEVKPDVEDSDVLSVSGCVDWHVARGDTMSKIMLECEGTVVYGNAMDMYAKSWISQWVKPGQSVYDGWNSSAGVGLFAGDYLLHEI